MRDSLAAKSARFAIAHPVECGVCANCIAHRAAEEEYNNASAARLKAAQAEMDARARLLAAGRTLRCTNLSQRERV